MSEHKRILESYYQRLISAVTRSPLLRLSVSRRGRLVDCTRLTAVHPAAPRELLGSVIEGKKPLRLDLQLAAPGLSEAELFGETTESAAQKLNARIEEHRSLFDALERRIHRHAELLRRETGVHALWLGYPLLYVVFGEGATRQWVLAPVFLWPVSLRIDHQHEGRISVGREKKAGPPKFNRALSAWIQRQLEFELPAPAESELEDLDLDHLPHCLNEIASAFQNPPAIDCSTELEPVPNARLVNPRFSPRFYNSAVLGIFRWQNEAILSDIERLKNLDEIQGVAEGFVTGKSFPMEDKAVRPPESDRYQVYDADFSQERVIWQARHHPGLVVHGPPGTGKSQTIVNIIADALAHGRTVLMVCQKHAAIRVVYEKLRAAGLDELCLEVTDSERSRLPVFRAIREQVDKLPRTVVPPGESEAVRNRERLAAEIEHVEEELDRYARALHERAEDTGLSYRQVKAKEGQLYRRFPTLRAYPPLQSVVGGCSHAQLDDLCRTAHQMGNYFAQSQPFENPWRFYQPGLQPTPVLRSTVGEIAQRLREKNAIHLESLTSGHPPLELPADLREFSSLARSVLEHLRTRLTAQTPTRLRILSAWTSILQRTPLQEWNALQASCEQVAHLAEEARKTPVDETWRNRSQGRSERELQYIDREAEALLNYRRCWWRFFSPRFRRAQRAMRRFEPDAPQDVLWGLAEDWLAFREAIRLRKELQKAISNLGLGLRPKPEDDSMIRFALLAGEELSVAIQLAEGQREERWKRELMELLQAGAENDALSLYSQRLEEALARTEPVAELLREIQGLASLLQPEGLEEPQQRVRQGHSLEDWINRLLQGIDGLQSMVAFDLSYGNLQGPAKAAIDQLWEYEWRRKQGEAVPRPPETLREEDHGAWWEALLRYTAIMDWLARSHQRHPELVQMTPDSYEKKRKHLATLLNNKRGMEVPVIRELWQRKQIKHRGENWKRMFQLRRSRYGDAKRLREAVELSLGRGLLTMRPCWLMNPGTISEVFPLQAEIFDLVIFDEASQCPIEHAVPTVFRGSALVVSGDEKQLPPTSFFTSSWNPAEGDELPAEEEATDDTVRQEQLDRRIGAEYLLQVEDLLSGSIGMLPERYLQVHYRSRHPALIEFSNQAFYGGRLEAPPPHSLHANGRAPIRYFDVGGLYARRTNRDEARKVVDLLRSVWLSEEACPTIGVVTFNQAQRDLIEDLIEEECHRDSRFNVRYQQESTREQENQDVGFFVKNLENVQGDERDVMIFSTTFGRDETGRFYRRFGPVGAVGGERRLNVAVTRAREKVIVVSSMPIHEIGTALAADSGVGSTFTPADYLQLYLAYARSVSEGDSENVRAVLARLGASSRLISVGSPESPFEEDVLNVLEKMGYTVHCQVGDAGFRIDLAVLGEEASRGYVLGIECDGASYHSDRSARLRDVWRERILRSYGWRIHRIWSTRWWYHRGEEIDRLQRAVEEAMQAQTAFSPPDSGRSAIV